jgi:Uma2 family endonuclease
VHQPYQPTIPTQLPPRPTMYDLPSEDPEEPGLPDQFHDFQPQLLRETCQPVGYDQNFFIGVDLNLYYDLDHPLWHKRPDWFLVLGNPAAQTQVDLRWSYVMWQEQVAPFLVVELLSPGTEAEDLGQVLWEVGTPPPKWQVYEQILQVPYYVVFDRYENQLRVFRLNAGRYEAVTLSEPRFWFAETQTGLGVWQGSYQGITGLWLRWYDPAGNWLPTPQEQASQERLRAELESQRANLESQRAEQEAQRAELADQRAEQAIREAHQEAQRAEQADQRAEQAIRDAERLAARLRALGINPDEI